MDTVSNGGHRGARIGRTTTTDIHPGQHFLQPGTLTLSTRFPCLCLSFTLRSNSQTITFTLCKCPIQGLLGYLQSCPATAPTPGCGPWPSRSPGAAGTARIEGFSPASQEGRDPAVQGLHLFCQPPGFTAPRTARAPLPRGFLTPSWRGGEACGAGGSWGEQAAPTELGDMGQVPPRSSPVTQEGPEPRCVSVGRAQGLGERRPGLERARSRRSPFSAAAISGIICQWEKGRRNTWITSQGHSRGFHH